MTFLPKNLFAAGAVAVLAVCTATHAQAAARAAAFAPVNQETAEFAAQANVDTAAAKRTAKYDENAAYAKALEIAAHKVDLTNVVPARSTSPNPQAATKKAQGRNGEFCRTWPWWWPSVAHAEDIVNPAPDQAPIITSAGKPIGVTQATEQACCLVAI